MNSSQWPYPGLRSYRVDESHLFFGRDRERDHLIQKLLENGFLSITGVSGCGKSSLAKAGLIGYLKERKVQGNWWILEMQATQRPLTSFCNQFISKLKDIPEADSQAMPTPEECMTNILKDPYYPVDIIDGINFFKNQNTLVLVDQFEEILKNKNEPGTQSSKKNGKPDREREKEAFTYMLLNCARQQNLPFYVVVTIRSDYIGKCTKYIGLTEIMDKGNYLVPRLSQFQIRDAIVKPASKFNGEIEPALLNQFNQYLRENPNDLPIVQFCLRKIWQKAAENQETHGKILMTANHLKEISPDNYLKEISPDNYLKKISPDNRNRIKYALSFHAEKVYDDLDKDLDKRNQKIAEILFKQLCEGSDTPDDPPSRRQVAFSQLLEVTHSILQTHEIEKPAKDHLDHEAESSSTQSMTLEHAQNIINKIFETNEPDTKKSAAVSKDDLKKVSKDGLKKVIKAFSNKETCFLRPVGNISSIDNLKDDDFIEIVHEKIISTWHRLEKWVSKENESADLYRHLIKDIKYGREPLSSHDLLSNVSKINQYEWTKAWSLRYSEKGDGDNNEFVDIGNFLRKSLKKAKEEKEKQEAERAEREKQAVKQKWMKRFFISACIVIPVIVLLLIFSYHKQQQYLAQKNKAENRLYEAMNTIQELNQKNIELNHVKDQMRRISDKLSIFFKEKSKAPFFIDQIKSDAVTRDFYLFLWLELDSSLSANDRIAYHELMAKMDESKKKEFFVSIIEEIQKSGAK